MMKCPYCGNEMQEGKICALRGALLWKDSEESFRLNDEPKLAAVINGDRIEGYHCKKCRKIIVGYE